jgi:Ca2+-binding RTX toxin-like protein
VISAGTGSAVIVAGAGATTIDGSSSSGPNSFFAGSGNDLISSGKGLTAIEAGSGSDTLISGSGATLFGFTNGKAGTALIENFDPGRNALTLQGFGPNEVTTALSCAVISGGSETISLSDGTHITFAGFTNLTATSFV